VVYGGVNVFKTSTITWALYRLWRRIGMAYTGARYIVAGLDLPQIRDSFLAEWRNYVDPRAYTYDANKSTIRLSAPSDGVEIVFKTSGHYREGAAAVLAATRRRGGNFHGVYFVQGESCPESVANEVLGRRIRGKPQVRPGYKGPLPPYRTIVIDANPDSPQHWVYKRYLDSRDENDQYVPGADVHAIPTTVETSTYTQAELDERRRLWQPHETARLLDARWVTAAGVIYPKYRAVESIHPSQVSRYWVAFDPGTAEDTGAGNLGVIVLAKLIDGPGWAIVDERLMSWRGLDYVADTFRALVEHWGSYGAQYEGAVRDWSGGAGRPIGDYLEGQRLGPVYAPSSKKGRQHWFPVEAGITLVYEGFVTERLVVSKACTGVLEELALYARNERGEPDKKIFDAHRLDAVRYGMIRIGEMGGIFKG
jgi:hypothetical protein